MYTREQERMTRTIHTSIHNVANIETECIELKRDAEGEVYYVKKLLIETTDGVGFSLTLFSDDAEGLEVG